jgi:hypothetical protein
MGRFTIGIMGRGKSVHVACFEDFAKALANALRQLGHEVTDFGPEQGRLILFGVNNSFPVEGSVPDGSIIYNTEQMTSFGGDVRKQMQNFDEWSKRCVIWDYSSLNASKLRAAGASRVVHCPLGYVPSMTTIEPAPIQDIDVLFYGSVNPRRRAVLDALDAAGLSVVRLYGVYGSDRDAVIARSKVVLNLHYYENAVFEIFRVSHLLANKKCVVSEGGGEDTELEEFAERATACVPIDRIVSMCGDLLLSERAVGFRQCYEEAGFMEFSKLDLVEHVRKALEQS